MKLVKHFISLCKLSLLSLVILTPGEIFAQANNFHKYIDLQSNAVTKAIDTDGNDFILTGFFFPGSIGGLANGNDRIHLTKLNNSLGALWNKTYVTQTEFDSHNLAWTLMRAYDVKPTSDGGYIVCGEMIEEGVTNNPFLMKTNANGGVQWFKIYWDTDRGRLNSVIETPNGDFVSCGYGIARASSDQYARVMKTDANGTVQWTKEVYGNVLNSNNNPYYSAFNEVIQYGSDYALVGICNNYFFLSITDVLVTVVNDNGGTVNNWIYGITQDAAGNFINEYGQSIIADGTDLIIGGTYDAIAPNHCFSAFMDAMIFKINNTGALLFQNRYDLNSSETGMQITLAGGQAVLLGNSSPDAFLLNVDKNNGAPISAEKYNYNTSITAQSLTLDASGDVRFVGNTPNLQPPPMDYDWVYLVQQYAGHYQHCNDWDHTPTAVSISFDRPNPMDMDLLKTDAQINVLDFDVNPIERDICLRNPPPPPPTPTRKNSSQDNVNGGLPLELLLEAQPNPSIGSSTVHYSLPESGKVSISMYDQTGRIVISLIDNQLVNAGSYKQEINTSGVAAGSYILKLEINGKSAIQNITVLK